MIRAVAGGWLGGFCVATGLGAFAWWNAYLALFCLLGGLVLTATAVAAASDGEQQRLDPNRDATHTRRYYTEDEIERLRRCDACEQHDGFYSPEHAAHLCSHCLASASSRDRSSEGESDA